MVIYIIINSADMSYNMSITEDELSEMFDKPKTKKTNLILPLEPKNHITIMPAPITGPVLPKEPPMGPALQAILQNGRHDLFNKYVILLHETLFEFEKICSHKNNVIKSSILKIRNMKSDILSIDHSLNPNTTRGGRRSRTKKRRKNSARGTRAKH